MAFVAISRSSVNRGILGLKQALCLPQKPPALLAPCHTMVKGDVGHDEKNMRLNRPMSPHLTIYKFEMTMALSISHRVTGIVLSAYTAGFGAAALMMQNDFVHYMSALESMNIGGPLVVATKFLVAFPFMFHTCNGIRHLTWDTANYLNKEAVRTTGAVMLAATAATTAAIMFL